MALAVVSEASTRLGNPDDAHWGRPILPTLAFTHVNRWLLGDQGCQKPPNWPFSDPLGGRTLHAVLIWFNLALFFSFHIWLLPHRGANTSGGWIIYFATPCMRSGGKRTVVFVVPTKFQSSLVKKFERDFGA